jgi:Mg-chelatase subunit ChlD
MRRHWHWGWLVNAFLFLVIVSVVRRWSVNGGAPPAAEPAGADADQRLVQALAPAETVAPREGIAAMVLIDVSGSMADSVRDAGGRRPKIEIARDAALELIRQFDTYAKAHLEEPVLVGLMEFSGRTRSSAREVIPLSPADPAKAELALAQLQPGGGTPIGDAMIAGKRALDQSGLSRRHLLIVTDGENTDGAKPADVMRALARRPESERPSVYFVAFDVTASRFAEVRDAGSLVLAAADAQELDRTLGSLLSGKILVEGP